MKTSTRNCFHGVISQIDELNGVYQIAVQQHDFIVYSHISPHAFARLQPKIGNMAIVMIKASAVSLMAEITPFRLSAENVLLGTIDAVERGAVNNIVLISLKNGENAVATITLDSSEHLDVHAGAEIYAVFNASNTILGVV